MRRGHNAAAATSLYAYRDVTFERHWITQPPTLSFRAIWNLPLAASGAGLGPEHLRFLYLYGSWEESRGELAAVWGTEQGPVRLLDVPLSSLALPDRLAVVLRFLRRETEFLNGGGRLTQGHHRSLAQAWNRSCEQFTVDQRATVRAAAPTEVWMDFAGCP